MPLRMSPGATSQSISSAVISKTLTWPSIFGVISWLPRPAVLAGKAFTPAMYEASISAAVMVCPLAEEARGLASPLTVSSVVMPASAWPGTVQIRGMVRATFSSFSVAVWPGFSIGVLGPPFTARS